MANEYDNSDSGFIRLQWNRRESKWQLSGTWTNERSEEFDLGYVSTGSHGLQKGLETIVAMLPPTLSGKGNPRKERENKGQNRKGGR